MKGGWSSFAQLIAAALLLGCTGRPEQEQQRAATPIDSVHPTSFTTATSAPDVTVLDSVVVGQPPGLGVTLYSGDTLRNIANEISKGSSTADVFLNRPGLQAVEARRVVNGSPEVHADWADATLVQAGRATLLSGGTVHGGQLRSPGELRGGSIAGGQTRKVAAGDFFVVPPGVPHQYLVAKGDSIRYLTIKVPRIYRAH